MADTSNNLRLFLALWPDDRTRTALTRLQAPLNGRLVPYSNLHLTLAFLGQQPHSVLARLKEILAHLSTPAVTLDLDKLDYFGNRRIAWIGARRTPPELSALHEELREALLREDIAFDDRKRFKPHITLARDASLPPDLVFEPIRWHADQVVLVHSIPESNGPGYRVLESRSLDQPGRFADAAPAGPD